MGEAFVGLIHPALLGGEEEATSQGQGLQPSEPISCRTVYSAGLLIALEVTHA